MPIRAVIDLAALRANFAALRRAAPRARAMAVVKADAYGHGAVRVAAALDAAEGFAVARLDEALTLRAAGILTPILLLEGVSSRSAPGSTSWCMTRRRSRCWSRPMHRPASVPARFGRSSGSRSTPG